MNPDELVAIDIHTHAGISCRHPEDEAGRAFDEAAERYFGFSHRPGMAETIDDYRARRIGLVMFSVGADFQTDRQRVSNEDVAAIAAQNSEIMLAFASIDPHRGKQGLREARRLIEDHEVAGFKFHPTPDPFVS
jgi:uncharacterized protein